MLKIFVLLVAVLALNAGLRNTATATHIIGGELSYRCLDPATNYYEFTVKLYRSCRLKADGVTPTSIYFDTEIFVSLYDSMDNLIMPMNMYLQPTDTLDNKTYAICLFAPPDVCVEEGIYREKFFLPSPPSPNMHYTMTYQRCCRNAGISNIINPGPPGSPPSVGAAWALNIPDSSKAYCNSSPVFKNYPPTIICLGDTMYYDHSAIDLDGDSLVYGLCAAYTISTFNMGGGIQNPALPTSFYYGVNYYPPYTYDYPIDCSGPGGDTLKIDPQTGLLTIKPTQEGMWVVAVCVYEYRDGLLINEHKRDFQFNVAACLTDPMTQFTFTPDPCEPRIVQFIYGGKGVVNWNWDFGVSVLVDDTSSEEHPIYTFPDYNSTYPAQLIVNEGYVCEDTFEMNIGIPPLLNADFGYVSVCMFDTVTLVDSSTTNNYSGAITGWDWNFMDDSTASGEIVEHQFSENLAERLVQLIVTTAMGCQDTTIDTVAFILLPLVDAGPDEWITIGGSVELAVTGAESYLWSPAYELSSISVWNPVASPLVTTEYQVDGVSEFQCKGRDTIIVNVVDAAVEIPNAFSPNGDGQNDIMYLLSVGVAELIEFKIFNRWGQVVFETNDFNIGWDGNYKDEPQEIGNYAYYYKAKTIDDEVKEGSGDIALIR